MENDEFLFGILKIGEALGNFGNIRDEDNDFLLL